MRGMKALRRHVDERDEGTKTVRWMRRMNGMKVNTRIENYTKILLNIL